jgi:hypothetical protein
MNWTVTLLDGGVGATAGAVTAVGTTYWALKRNRKSEAVHRRAEAAQMVVALLSEATNTLIEVLATDDYHAFRTAHREVQKKIGNLTSVLGVLDEGAKPGLCRLPALVNASAYPHCGPGFIKPMREGTIDALNTIGELMAICAKAMLPAA